jgi:hypothetical protein
MTTTLGTDEHRAIEAIAALLDLFPREPGEEDDSLIYRMASWGIQQGPDVRWEAIIYSTRAMVNMLPYGHHFGELSVVGLAALERYNQLGWRSPGY